MKRLPPLTALRVFFIAAREGSFTKAGAALHVTQGAVSRQVKRLEEDIGRPLFFRAHQGIELTEAGRTLAEGLADAFERMESAITRVREDQARRQIAINMPPTFATRWLAPRLQAFRSLYPYVDLQITTDWLRQPRDAQHCDCLVVFEQQAWPRLPCELLMQERHIMVAAPALWRHDAPPPLAQATLLHILNGTERLPVWERWIAAHGPKQVDPQPGLAFSTLDQAINAAVAGAGVAIVDEAMIPRELASGTLRRIGTDALTGPWGYWFIDSARDSEHKALVRLFGDYLMEQARGCAEA